MCLYSHSMGLFELADLLNLIHEISSVYVLHDKIQTVLRERDRQRVRRDKKKYMLIKGGERSQRKREKGIVQRWIDRG